jgi:hypothetical protein
VTVTGSEIVTFRQGAVLVASTLQAVVGATRQNSITVRQQVELLRVRSEQTLALARVGAVSELSRASIREIAETAREIGRHDTGHATNLYYADLLEQQHRSLRRIIDGFLA